MRESDPDSELQETRVEKGEAQIAGSELGLRFWSVISFDRCLASNLTYPEAVEEMDRHRQENVNGLCIVTDHATARLKRVEE